MSYLVVLVYAFFKAFLPLPSLEVMIIPCIIKENEFLIASFVGAIGTFLGGSVGFWLAYFLGNKIFHYLTNKEDVAKGLELIRKYGVLAVFIGGITPIPDCILPYLAGFVHMNFFAFAFSDSIARLIRSLLVGYCVLKFGSVIDFDKWGNYIAIAIIIFFVGQWLIKKKKFINKVDN